MGGIIRLAPRRTHEFSIMTNVPAAMHCEIETGILHLVPSVLSPRCVEVGDPARAKFLSKMLEQPQRVCKKREYHIYTGMYQGEKVSVASHGVGASGANILFAELAQCGV